MQAKSIHGNSAAEIKTALSKSMADGYQPTLAHVFISVTKEIAADIITNLEKILHYGKRADGIVKGMLQHSQRKTGCKEPKSAWRQYNIEFR